MEPMKAILKYTVGYVTGYALALLAIAAFAVLNEKKQTLFPKIP